MNGEDGFGNKVRTRNEVAKEVLHKVIDATSNSLIWGFNVFNSSPEAQLGSSINDVKAAVDTLAVSGGTPMSEALQDGYENNWAFFTNPAFADEAECANKFIILMTDGYPNGDDDWDRINLDGNPVFNNISNSYVDDDGWVGLDANDNYGDDVAKWMHTEATYKHTVHTIGFGLDHPLLQDMADSSGGIYITAFNEGQLINAFHSLSLAMTESQSFVAPVVSVDQANRTQSGDKIYTAFFRPQENDYWIGNLKKYGLRLMQRTECGRTTSEWVVVGSDNQPAVDCYGNFYPTSKSIWSKVADGGEAAAGGVGALLKDAMPGPHPTNVDQGGKWWDFRNMYTYDSDTSSMVRFIRDNITSTDLGVADDAERDKVVNFMYGYEFAVKDPTKGSPTFKREWILGDMVHSEPTIVDYLDKDNGLEARFIVAGANDGLLHVFTDQAITLTNAAGKSETYDAGREIWAFVPEDLLPNLKNFGDPSLHYYFVDGFSSLYRSRSFNDDNPAGSGGVNNGIRDADEYYNKTLVFSERRGGNSYWALDVSKPNPMDWTVKWHIQGGGTYGIDNYYELQQTWSKPIFSRIQTGASTFKDVVIFAGGYDPEEDGYPEPWEDDDEDGIKDTGESHTDTPGGTASTYDYFNPDENEHGRGIYVVDLETGEPVFRALNGMVTAETTAVSNGSPTHTFTSMKWSFPADTTVIPLNLYRTSTDYGYRTLVIYAPDVYGNIWKVVYDYNGAGETNKQWQARRIFSANPGSNQAKALDGVTTTPTTVSSDWGRKMFYPPDVSYRGTSWTDYPTLFVGTGDRPHPRYMAFNPATGEGYHDRFYVVADTESPFKPSDDATYPLDETYLLNLTCDELEAVGDVDQDGSYSPDDTDDDNWRAVLRNILFHNPDTDCSDPDCDYPANGQYARGWYRIMGKQGDCTQDSRDHTGEKVLSRPTLFYKVVYFTTFQPYFGDPCRPSGDALVYALNYDVGTAAFNLNLSNDSGGDIVEDLSDTYSVVQDSTIASGVRVITRGGKAAGVFSAGGSIVGAGEKDGAGTSTSIPGPPGGASRIMWETF
jgi:type IV pilus assembly protein PilY1